MSAGNLALVIREKSESRTPDFDDSPRRNFSMTSLRDEIRDLEMA